LHKIKEGTKPFHLYPFSFFIHQRGDKKHLTHKWSNVPVIQLVAGSKVGIWLVELNGEAGI
jgi:hypothetical protein